MALTWESISHPGCPASLGFHGQRRDKGARKVYDDPITSLSLYAVNIPTAELPNPAATCSSSLKGLVYGAILHRKALITKQKVSGALQQFSINNHLTRKYRDSKKTSYHLGNVHKSHLIKHKSLVHEIRVQKAFQRSRRERFFWVVRNIHLCKDTVISFMFVFPFQPTVSGVQRDKGLSCNSSFPRSHHNTSMVRHYRICRCYAV